MDNRTIMKVVMTKDRYNPITDSYDYSNSFATDMLNFNFLLYPTGRVHVTYVPVTDSDMFKVYGDLVLRHWPLEISTWDYFLKYNRTCSHPFLHYAHNMLSYFHDSDYQLSLTGILQVFHPQVWIILSLFLILFSFKLWNLLFAITKRFVPKLRQVSLGVYRNKYDTVKKIILATYLVGSFLLVEVFKANLSTKLTVDIDRNINYFHDIFKYPDLRIVFQRNNAFLYDIKEMHQDIFKEYQRRLKKFQIKKGYNPDNIFNKGKAVYFGSVSHLEYFCHYDYSAEKALHYGKDPLLPYFNIMEMSNNASTVVKDVINIRLMHFWETGHQIRSQYHMKSCSHYLHKKQSMAFSKTTFSDVGISFLLFAGSTMLCSLVLVAEIWYASKNIKVKQARRDIMELDIRIG